MDDELDRLLRAGARPLPDRAAADELSDDVWTRLRHHVREDEPTAPHEDLQRRRLAVLGERELSARRRRRSARAAGIALTVVVAGAGTAAATDYLATRTGAETVGWEQDAAGRGELLNPAGTDRAEVFDEVTAGIVFPPGYEAARQYELDFYPPEADARVTEGVLRSAVARGAVCSWADAWVAAQNAGDADAQDAAATVLAGAPSWPDIVENDFPDADHQPDGNGRSYNGWIPPLAAAAAAGDRQAVLDEVAGSHACSHQVIPVIDADPAYPLAGVR